MPWPEKLYRVYMAEDGVFQDLLHEVECAEPSLRRGETQRYAALYLYGRPLVYLDAQIDGFKLGFFRDYVRCYTQRSPDDFCAFAEWNRSRGGLVGFMLRGFGKDIRVRREMALELVKVSARRRREQR